MWQQREKKLRLKAWTANNGDGQEQWGWRRWWRKKKNLREVNQWVVLTAVEMQLVIMAPMSRLMAGDEQHLEVDQWLVVSFVEDKLYSNIKKGHCIETVGRDKWVTFVKYFTLVLSIKHFTIGWPNFTLWLENILQLTIFLIKQKHSKMCKIFYCKTDEALLSNKNNPIMQI